MKIKHKFNFRNLFSLLCILVLIVFAIYFFSNIIPRRTKYKFAETISEQNFINNYEIENQNRRIAIFLNIKDTIFKQYDYHSYISGEGIGKKIELQLYLISEDKSVCYKIKSYCYNYENAEELKFMGYYYNMFIDKKEKYNLAIYVPDTEILYMTDIKIWEAKERIKFGTYKKTY